MRQQQNHNGNAASSSRDDNETTPHEQPQQYICTWPSPVPGESPAVGGAFGYGPLNSAPETAPTSPSPALSYRPLPSPILCYRPLPSPVLRYRAIPSPVLRYRPLPSPPAEESSPPGTFSHGPGHSAPAGSAPLPGEYPEDDDVPRVRPAPEILGYGPWPPAQYTEPDEQGRSVEYYDLGEGQGASFGPSMLYGPSELGDSAESYSPELQHGPWPEEFYRYASGYDPVEQTSPPALEPTQEPQRPRGIPLDEFLVELFGRIPTPPPRPEEPKPSMLVSFPPLLIPCTCRFCRSSPPQEPENTELPEAVEGSDAVEDICTCDLHRQMRGEY